MTKNLDYKNTSKIIGIYLAAGNSQRMGCNKLELPLGEALVGSWALREALKSKINYMIVVTRHDDSLHWLTPFSKKNGWGYVRCMKESAGQSTSIKAGVNFAESLKADAVMILLGDQPFITMNGLNQLIHEFNMHKEIDVVASIHNGILKPPILFRKSIFGELSGLTGDKGARALLSNQRKKRLIEFEDWFFKDVDIKEDYESIRLWLEG